MKKTLIALILLACLGCEGKKPTVVSIAVDEDGAKQKATLAFQALGHKLKGAVVNAMESGGPVSAVEVCKTRAPEIAAEISEGQGFPLGRSSHRLRNKANEPTEAVAKYLEKYAGKNAKEVPVESSLGDGVWTIIAPIGAQPMCLTCHGDPKTFDPALKKALAAHYPDDKAVGFETAELRGVFWARVPEQPGALPKGGGERQIETH